MIITLLNMVEAERLPKELRQCETPKGYDGYESDGKCWWWLQSPGDFSYETAYVNVEGAFSYGYINNNKSYGVRPALQNLTPDEIKRMQKTKDGCFKFLGTKWIDISEYLGYSCLLKKKCLKKPHRFDSVSNNYITSEIKEFIKEWLDKSEEESEGMKRKHGDILDKIRLEMVKSARPIVSEYNTIEDGMSLRKILQIIDYWHNTESED